MRVGAGDSPAQKQKAPRGAFTSYFSLSHILKWSYCGSGAFFGVARYPLIEFLSTDITTTS